MKKQLTSKRQERNHNTACKPDNIDEKRYMHSKDEDDDADDDGYGTIVWRGHDEPMARRHGVLPPPSLCTYRCGELIMLS